MMTSINPFNNKQIQSYAETSAQEMIDILEQADKCQPLWASLSFQERGRCLKKLAQLLRQHKVEFAQLMAQEMGKPISSGQAEIEKCALTCEFFAEKAQGFLAPETITIGDKVSTVAFSPLGVILGIMPWNFPFWQVLRFAAPTLMAGNTIILKHASNVPGCSMAIHRCLQQALTESGFPPQVFSHILVPGKKLESLIAHPLIKGVSLTGSVQAGREVGTLTGKYLKKVVLELGGSDPYLVLEDADLDLAAEVCVRGRLVNSGQSCVAAKRFIVLRSIKKNFEELCVQKMSQFKMGDPLLAETQIGPMARVDLRDELHQQVERTLAQGARCLLGGKIPPEPGVFYPPTILTDVTPNMPANREELFGPVAAIIPVDSEEEALSVANDSDFGLGAALFTKDLEKAKRLALTRIQAGNVFINDNVKSDPALPFGGIKDSGFGRELSSYGIKEFVNIKTISLQT